MMMDPLDAFQETLASFNDFSLQQKNAFAPSGSSLIDPDVDWSVLENADRYLLRDDSAWITRLSNDFWWNLERISEMSTMELNFAQRVHRSNAVRKNVSQAPVLSPSMPMNNPSTTRKIVGQRSPPLRSNANHIPDKANVLPNFSFLPEQDIEYNPFQSKVSFDNHIWTNYAPQAIPWQ